MPDVPPPPQVWPVPEQVCGHWIVLPQLSTVGPQWPAEQVVAEGLSVQVEQSVPSAVHWLSAQVVVVWVGQSPLPSHIDLLVRTPPEQLWDAQTVALSKVQSLLLPLHCPWHTPAAPAQGARGLIGVPLTASH